MSTTNVSSGSGVDISITDGTTTKVILDGRILLLLTAVGVGAPLPFDFIVKLEAGDSLVATSGQVALAIKGCTRQIADLSGNLVNPT